MMIHDRKITITAGASRKATVWTPQSLMLSELYERLRVPVRGTETRAAYLAMKKPQQDELKDVGGFVAGGLNGSRRKGSAVAFRDLLTLDLDSIPPGETEGVLRRVDALGCGYCVYSTRKHAPEAPRLRVLLPLDRPCTADEYEPLARRMAAYIGIEMADPSTFEASRLMYWPSCCADSDYVYTFADKPMLSADGLLATYTDWHDVAQWPQVPGAPEAQRRLAARQEDPAGKSGVVGAFCRTYNIYRVLDELLPGVYEPVDGMPDRYTFTGGSTTGGAVVYDGGAFLYSHHATDPAGGKLCNAFDLARLHRFGDLDDAAAPGTPTNRLPSYTAMRELASGIPEVSALLLDERWREAAGSFTAAEDDGSWRRLLKMDTNGAPIKNMQNLQVILEHDPDVKGKLRLNLFSGRIDVVGDLPWRRPSGGAWSDDDAAQLRIWMEPRCGKVAKTDLQDAIAACASDQAYHPVRDYLCTLQWDGVPRLDTLFIDYLGAEDAPYIRAVTRKSLTAAVARVMVPGVKYDTMPVLVGQQGRHKSSILAILGGEWFSDSLRTFEGKDAMESIQGTWLNEVAEMHAMANSEITAVKAFLTKQNDYYRAAYGRYTADRPRQCVFFGTTNSKECLNDPTGGRRFWPVDIDLRPRRKHVFEDLPGERDQIWAEAVASWQLGEALYLPPELEAQAASVQEEHRARHPWEGLIADFLEQPVPEDWMKWGAEQRLMFHGGGARYEGRLVPRMRVCAVEVWCEVLGKPRGDFTQRATREINGLLERMPGWENAGVQKAGKPYGAQRCFDRKAVTD